MTDHLSKAKAKIAEAQRELDDMIAMTQSVSAELFDRARHAHSRIWPGTIGGLDYELPLAEVPDLMAQMLGVALEYRRTDIFAGTVVPAFLPVKGNEHLVEQFPVASFYLRGHQFDHSLEFKVIWYMASIVPEKLIRIEVDVTDARQWFEPHADAVRDRWDHIINWRYWAKLKLPGATESRASGGGFGSVKAEPHYTYWWPEDTELKELLP